MNSLFVLIPITLVLLLVAVLAWLWSVKSGQFDDLDCEASRILFDDIDEPNPADSVTNKARKADERTES